MPTGAARRSSALVLPRADLVEALERATTHRVTAISAPPGSGKTFLLRQWAHATARRVVSVAVRRGERPQELLAPEWCHVRVRTLLVEQAATDVT